MTPAAPVRAAGIDDAHAVLSGEELPIHVLAPALDEFLVAQVEGVLEVQQRDHQAHG